MILFGDLFMLIFLKKIIDKIKTNNSKIDIENEPLEVFMNERENKCVELYYKNGCYTYEIFEKLSDDYEGRIQYYWCPKQTTASFYDTKEKAIKEIMLIIKER